MRGDQIGDISHIAQGALNSLMRRKHSVVPDLDQLVIGNLRFHSSDDTVQ
jgi:hypothetical protein